MNRLGIRVFLSFWVVIVLTLVAVVLINSQIDRYVRGEEFAQHRSEFIERRLLTPARNALAQRGREGLERWLVLARARTRTLGIEIVDERGRALLGGRVARHNTRLIESWRSGNLD